MLRCLAEVQPRFDPVVGGFECRDAVMRSQRSNALACPAIAVACEETVAVQDAGDEIVIGDRCQLAHGDNDVGGFVDQTRRTSIKLLSFTAIALVLCASTVLSQDTVNVPSDR
jgi:hypothetical protein